MAFASDGRAMAGSDTSGGGRAIAADAASGCFTLSTGAPGVPLLRERDRLRERECERFLEVLRRRCFREVERDRARLERDRLRAFSGLFS